MGWKVSRQKFPDFLSPLPLSLHSDFTDPAAAWRGREPKGGSLCEGHRSLELAGLWGRRTVSWPISQAAVMSSGPLGSKAGHSLVFLG